MPAEVESMFSVREMPWHRQGHVLPDYPGSWAAARPLAGLAWEPAGEPVYAVAGIEPDGQPHYEAVKGWKRISRSDTGTTLSVARDSYTVIDHGEMGEIVEAVLAQSNVRWETAGVLSEGRAVWCLARLDEPIELPGDQSLTLPYLAITNRHDGTGACALRATAVRIVCANTFRAAELEGRSHGATFAFVHKRGWRDRIDEARQAVTGVRREMARYQQLSQELLGVRVGPEQQALFCRLFIPEPPAPASKLVMRRTDDARATLRRILASPTTAPVAHTAYGLVQAAGEYLDHMRTARTWETRLQRTMIRPEPQKARALTLAREVATA